MAQLRDIDSGMVIRVGDTVTTLIGSERKVTCIRQPEHGDEIGLVHVSQRYGEDLSVYPYHINATFSQKEVK